MLNPYAAHLGKLDPVEVMAESASRLRSCLERLGPLRADSAPATGKWSPREVLCHLADCEIVFAYRLRQTLAEDRHVIQPFDQDRWASTYGGCDAPAALAVFSALREWNLALIRHAGPAGRAKKVAHPERGEMTFGTIVETIAGHDLNHLRQLETLAGA